LAAFITQTQEDNLSHRYLSAQSGGFLVAITFYDMPAIDISL